MSPHHRLALLLLAACLALLGAPAAARATSVAVGVGTADPTAEVGVPVVASGVAGEDGELQLRAVRLPDGCDGRRAAQLQRILPPGPYAVEGLLELEDPGAYRLCAVFEPYGSPVEHVAEVPLTVRPARTLVTSVRAPRVVALGSVVHLRVAGVAEAGRWVTSAVVPAGTPCARDVAYPHAAADAGPGPFAQSATGRLGVPGRWTVCVRVFRDLVADGPEQTIAVPLLVSLPCTRAARRLAAARERWRAASRAAILAGRPDPARLRRLGRAIARARPAVAARCDARARERLGAATS